MDTAANRLKTVFQSRTVLCDGAMGTALYSRGISIYRCYDELNLSDPGLVRTIHEEYLQAGAEIIETNTFGANCIRLERHGLQDRVFEINRAGAKLARQATSQNADMQASQAWVAGAIGPLGTHLEPVGKISLNEAFAAFSDQVRGLVAGGVDLLIIETITALNEAEQALKAAHAVAPDLPVIAMFTVDEDANLLDGSSPELAAQRLEEWGADAIGCNCSVGPATVLTAIERIASATRLPLAAMPNAGLPRAIEGRNIYPCTPEYMASFARKFLQAGVQFIGGCCGTTPNHIRAMKSAFRAADAQTVSEQDSTVAPILSETPLADRSQIGNLVSRGEFVTMIETIPPREITCSKEIEGARLPATLGVHTIGAPFGHNTAAAEVTADVLPSAQTPISITSGK
jgi:methionine synthase I (cobalamin-dependent)